MTRWAALPRSINAGKPLKMADLRAFLELDGMTDVRTSLASGEASPALTAAPAPPVRRNPHPSLSVPAGR